MHMLKVIHQKLQQARPLVFVSCITISALILAELIAFGITKWLWPFNFDMALIAAVVTLLAITPCAIYWHYSVTQIIAEKQKMLDQQVDLAKKNQFFQAVLDNISQGVCVYDQDWKLAAWSRGYRDILDLPEYLLTLGRPIADVIRFNAMRGEYGPGDVDEIVNRRLSEITSHLVIQPHSYERAGRDGKFIEVRGNRMPGGGLVATYTDITERHKVEDTIKQLALNDPLTGLANRNLFYRRLDDAMHLCERLNRHLALLLIDLDKFKPINDQYGHPVGDEVLIQIARRLEQNSRQIDTVARLGGDEFAIIFTNLEQMSYAEAPTQRLIKAITEPMEVNKSTLAVGVSIGLSFYPHDGNTAKELVRKADLALYASKANARSQFVRYDATLEARQIIDASS